MVISHFLSLSEWKNKVAAIIWDFKWSLAALPQLLDLMTLWFPLTAQMTREGGPRVQHHVHFIGKQKKQAVLPTTGCGYSNFGGKLQTRSCLHQHQWTPAKCHQVKPCVSQTSIYAATKRPASWVTCCQCQFPGWQEGPCWSGNTAKLPRTPRGTGSSPSSSVGCC